MVILTQRHIRWNHSIRTRLDKLKCLGLRWFIDVIEKYATNSSILAAMRHPEIVVAPFLEASIVRAIVLIASGLQRLMEVYSVLLVEIVRRQIRSATEPPLLLAFAVDHLEVSIIEMDRRHQRVARMNHCADPGGKELQLALGQEFASGSHLLNGSWWQDSGYDRCVYAGLLEDVSILEDACDSTAAFRTFPAIDVEASSKVLGAFERFDEVRLDLHDEEFHFGLLVIRIGQQMVDWRYGSGHVFGNIEGFLNDGLGCADRWTGFGEGSDECRASDHKHTGRISIYQS